MSSVVFAVDILVRDSFFTKFVRSSFSLLFSTAFDISLWIFVVILQILVISIA